MPKVFELGLGPLADGGYTQIGFYVSAVLESHEPPPAGAWTIAAGLDWDLTQVAAALEGRATIFGGVDEAVAAIVPQLRREDHVVVMSNGAFGDIHSKLLQSLPVS